MSEREKLEAAVQYFEDAVRESDEILEQCSEPLRRELTEQKEHFVVALEAMRQVLAWDWVPVAERRPKPFVPVLCHCPEDAPLPTVHEGYIDNDGKWHSATVYMAGRVTDWMEMPGGPEGH